MVELEADLLDMADCSSRAGCRAPNVEIVGGDLEAGAEAVQAGQHLEALVRRLGHQPVRPAS